MSELAIGLGGAIIGAILGAVLTYLASVRLADREQGRRRDDEARDLARRQGEMRVALAAALDANVRILDGVPPRIGPGNARMPVAVDLVILEATAQAKYGLLEVAACAEVDRARARLAAIPATDDHVRALLSQRVHFTGVGRGEGPAQIARERDHAVRVLRELIGEARAACDEALVALRGRGALPKPAEPAKPAKPAEPVGSEGDELVAPAESAEHGGG